MRSKKEPTPAVRGSISREAQRDLWIMREAMATRARLFNEFLGVRLRPSRIREAILRVCLIEFADGHERRLSFYQRALAEHGSSFAIRDEVHRLAHFRVLILENDPKDARAILVRPAQHFVDWYVERMPTVVSEWYRLMEVWHSRQGE
jgi:hypothetical protein